MRYDLDCAEYYIKLELFLHKIKIKYITASHDTNKFVIIRTRTTYVCALKVFFFFVLKYAIKLSLDVAKAIK